jgi:uncharacterized LabA/DUF88 family protein
MTFNSSTETVAVLYDIENAPFEMLDYALGKARSFMPCRMIAVSDWEKIPDQRRWNHLMQREGFTFRQIDRKVMGKNSLDYALFDMGVLLYKEGVRRFFIITTDADFVELIKALRKNDDPAYVIGVGTEQANHELREAYDKFYCYPAKHDKKKEELETKTDTPQEAKPAAKVKTEKAPKKVVKKTKAAAAAKTEKIKKTTSRKKKDEDVTKPKETVRKASVKGKSQAKDELQPANKAKVPKTSRKTKSTAKTGRASTSKASSAAVSDANLQVKLPKTLCENLQKRAQDENVDMDQLITYILMRGLMK